MGKNDEIRYSTINANKSTIDRIFQPIFDGMQIICLNKYNAYIKMHYL